MIRAYADTSEGTHIMLDPTSHDRNDPVSCAAEALGLARAIATLLRTDPALPRNRVPATGLDSIAQDCAEGAIFADAFAVSLAEAIPQLEAFVVAHTVAETEWYPDADESLHACRREIVTQEARPAAEASRALRRLLSLIERLRDLRAARLLLGGAP